jgi:hypothetical protein
MHSLNLSKDDGVKLRPCPLCGGKNTRIDESTYWTGMRSEVVSATLRHWCEPVCGDVFANRTINIRARNEAQATDIWNRRHNETPSEYERLIGGNEHA